MTTRLSNEGWIPPLLVVVFAVSLRLMPELLAYPHPIGYDVVNYYIPIVSDLDGHWPSIFDDFPVYVLILYSISFVTGLSAQAVVVGSAIAIFGLFAFSVFNLGKTMLRLANWDSLFLATFVIVQLAVLRSTWDLHRDMLALSTMFVIFGLLSIQRKGLLRVALMVALCCFVVASDKMVGLLVSVALVTGAVVRRTRELAVLAIISSVLFISLLGPELLKDNTPVAPGRNATTPLSPISAVDYVVLFGILNGVIAIPAILGFKQAKDVLLGVPFILCGLGAFAWIFTPGPSLFVPERWTILFGIFASIFAGYFLIRLLRHRTNRKMVASVIIAAFGFLGLTYAVMPYDSIIFPFTVAKPFIEDFMPVTMQFNSLDVDDNDELLQTIEAINESTEKDALIVGSKHWRGFMDVSLEDQREYKYSDSPRDLGIAHLKLGRNVYLIEPTESTSAFDYYRLED